MGPGDPRSIGGRRTRAEASRAAAGLAVLALALAGCGGPTGDATDARAAVETLLTACAEGHPTVVLESLTEPSRRAFSRGRSTGEACNDVLGLPPASPEEAAKPFEEARVGAVEASGGIARATIEAGERRAEVEVERVGGRWLVTNPEVPTG